MHERSYYSVQNLRENHSHTASAAAFFCGDLCTVLHHYRDVPNESQQTACTHRHHAETEDEPNGAIGRRRINTSTSARKSPGKPKAERAKQQPNQPEHTNQRARQIALPTWNKKCDKQKHRHCEHELKYTCRPYRRFHQSVRLHKSFR